MTTARHPTGQDLACLVCHKADNIDIDHVVNRGMGGSKERDVPENKVPLCRDCHAAKTKGVLETRVRSIGSIGLDLKTGATNYGDLWYEWRRKGAGAPWIPVPVEVSQRYKCLVLSDGGEDKDRTPAISPPSSSSLSTKEEDDGLVPDGISTGDNSTSGAMGKRTKTSSPDKPTSDSRNDALNDSQHRSVLDSGALTHEQRVAVAASIKGEEQQRQWRAGDTGNAWIAELGESAEQYLSDFGYQPESLANILRVCAAIPPPYRNGNLRFSHHVVVYQENREDMEMWLDRCEEEQWSVAEFRRQVKGTKARVKRWSREELRSRWVGFWPALQQENPEWDYGTLVDAVFTKFLDWLGEQEGGAMEAER